MSKTLLLMKLILFLFVLTPSFASFSQITKNNWLVGGSGEFSKIKVHDETTNYLQLSPNIGYFFFDKFAAGLKCSYTNYFGKTTGNIAVATARGLYIGPFTRFYLLSTDKQFNILLEATYQHGWEKKGDRWITTKYSLDRFSFTAGPAVYFNSCVGLEFLIGYSQSKYTVETFHESKFQMGVGLQVHLEKN